MGEDGTPRRQYSFIFKAGQQYGQIQAFEGVLFWFKLSDFQSERSQCDYDAVAIIATQWEYGLMLLIYTVTLLKSASQRV